MEHIADFLNEVHRQLDMPVGQKLKVERELLSHYRDILQDLRASGMEEAQAEREAVSRLGDPAEIAARLNPVHNSASWQSAFLCAFPFFAWALCVMMPTHAARLAVGVLLGGIILIGSIRELILRKRPIWLTTWLAVSYSGIRELATTVLPDPHGAGFGPTMATVAALAALFIIIVCWNNPQWRWRGIGFSLLYLGAGILERKPGLQNTLGSLCMLAVIVSAVASVTVLAMALFADSRNGNASRASFFVFAFFTCLYLWPEHFSAGQVALAFAAVGLAAVAFARAVHWRKKTGALALGLFAKAALLDVLAGQGYNTLTHRVEFDYSRYLVGLLFLGAIYVGGTLTPMLSERADRGDRRAVAS